MSAPLRASSDGHPELAVAWVLHGLEPDEDAVFAAHLGGCAGCLRIVAETEDVTTLLGSAVTVADPPSSLRDRILAEAVGDGAAVDGAAASASKASMLAPSDRKAPSSGEPDRQVDDAPSPTPAVGTGTAAVGTGTSSDPAPDATVIPIGRRRGPDAGRGRWVRRATAGIAVAAVLALVVAIGGLVANNRSLTAQRDAATAEAARGQEIAGIVGAAAQPGTPHAVLSTPQGGIVGLVVDRGRGAEVLATGLAPNDADHTYVLWGLADGTPVGLAAFQMSGSGPVVQSVPSVEAAGRFGGFAVSLEPGHSVPAAPTQVVASGQTAG